jgi:hypothetical protein
MRKSQRKCCDSMHLGHLLLWVKRGGRTLTLRFDGLIEHLIERNEPTERIGR